jgi:hypothetical protein
LTSDICQDCHSPSGSIPGSIFPQSMVPAYKEAMHSRCLACHQDEIFVQENPESSTCITCHAGVRW